jgi:hypothetical protein
MDDQYGGQVYQVSLGTKSEHKKLVADHEHQRIIYSLML